MLIEDRYMIYVFTLTGKLCFVDISQNVSELPHTISSHFQIDRELVNVVVLLHIMIA